MSPSRPLGAADIRRPWCSRWSTALVSAVTGDGRRGLGAEKWKDEVTGVMDGRRDEEWSGVIQVGSGQTDSEWGSDGGWMAGAPQTSTPLRDLSSFVLHSSCFCLSTVSQRVKSHKAIYSDNAAVELCCRFFCFFFLFFSLFFPPVWLRYCICLHSLRVSASSGAKERVCVCED